MLEYSFFKKNLFFFACAGSSLLHRLFSSFSEWELLCVAVFGLLIAEASLVAEHGLQSTGLVTLRHVGFSWTRD